MKQLVVLLLFLGANQLFAQHVFFGERNLDSLEWTKSPGVCFDKNGWVYPDFFIADSSMRNSNNNLKDFYLSHPAITKQIFRLYDLPKSQVLMGDLTVLNQRIIDENCKRIGQLNKEEVFFYVHGYRKSFHKIENGISSVEEVQNLRKFLTEEKYSVPTVAIYWDGMYDCCFSLKKKRNRELFQLFQTAYDQSLDVGNGFTQLLVGVKQKHVTVIAHSLGNRMYLAAISNPKLSNFFTNHQVTSLLIAPATSVEQLNNCFNEVSKNVLFWNSSWKIVYNEYDFALRKKDSKLGIFGPGHKKYGETELGCNKGKRLTKFHSRIKKEQKNFDFELIDASSIGKKHSLHYYTTFLKGKI